MDKRKDSTLSQKAVNGLSEEKANYQIATQRLLDQIKILEIEKGELKEENDRLKKKLSELGHPDTKDIKVINKSGVSLLERIGGKDKLKKIIDLQYELMLKHDEIGNQFHTMAYYCPESLVKLKEHQLQFTQNLYGKKCPYTGRTLRQVHKFKGITPEDFDIWVECCTEAYGIMGVDKETTEEGMEILKDLKEGVVI